MVVHLFDFYFSISFLSVSHWYSVLPLPLDLLLLFVFGYVLLLVVIQMHPMFLVCFVFPPRFLLSSILSNLYSCTCGRSSFLSKSNILYFSFSFIAFSLMVVFCPVTSVKSKVLGRLLHFLRQICVIFITC